MNLPSQGGRLPRGLVPILWAVTLLAGIALAAAAWTDPQRLWANLLLVAFLLTGLGLGGLLFLSLHYVTGAQWSKPLRPVAVAIARLVPYGAAFLGATLIVGLSYYPWTHEDLVAHPTFWFKAAWLEPSLFLVRTAIYLLAWVLLAAWMIRVAKREELDDDQTAHRRCVRVSATLLAIFAVTFWLAVTDWIMSLEPHWYSTIFAVYHFSGVLVGGVALVAVLGAWLRKRGVVDGVLTTCQLHDLGKLLFGLSSFWMYLWFSQYLLIWYANIPEETVYFVRRTEGLWQPLFVLNVCLNWAIPFLVLLPRAAKRNAGILVKVAGVLLAGRWIDLYLSVAPSVAPDAPLPGFAEFGTVLGGAVVLALLILQVRQQAPAPARIAARQPAPSLTHALPPESS